MLIDFTYLFQKYHVHATGVLHIGANTGQEEVHYAANGIERIIWVEADPETFDKLSKSTTGKIPNTIFINACIGENEGEVVDFNLSNNDRQSSSFLPLGTHATVHPDVVYTESIKATIKRIDNIFHASDFKMTDYTFLNIDIQGAELMALKGMGKLLAQVEYAYLEVNKAELYIGCALIDEIDSYMSLFDFVRVETLWAGNTNWGDAFYIKRNLL